MPTQKQFLDSVGLTELLDELGQYLKTNIPTVNNATLTIQKNGTNVATFTANASTGATANITVPTATSDLTNDSGFLGDVDVSYDTNTKTLIIGGSVNKYTITLSPDSYSFKDNDDNIITFPLEVNESDRFYAKIRAYSYTYEITITMNGVNITTDVVSASYPYQIIDIPSVTGDVSIVVSSGGSIPK